MGQHDGHAKATCGDFEPNYDTIDAPSTVHGSRWMEDKCVSFQTHDTDRNEDCTSIGAAHDGLCIWRMGGIRDMVCSIEIGCQCVSAEVDAAESVHCYDDLASMGI